MSVRGQQLHVIRFKVGTVDRLWSESIFAENRSYFRSRDLRLPHLLLQLENPVKQRLRCRWVRTHQPATRLVLHFDIEMTEESRNWLEKLRPYNLWYTILQG